MEGCDQYLVDGNTSARSHGGGQSGQVLRRNATVAVHPSCRINGLVTVGEAYAGQEPRTVHTLKKNAAPSRAPVSQPKAEFPLMADRIFLVLPPNPLTDRAEATFEIVVTLLQKTLICPIGLESANEIPAFDFGELEATDESFESDSIFEYYGNPLANEFGTTMPPP